MSQVLLDFLCRQAGWWLMWFWLVVCWLRFWLELERSCSLRSFRCSRSPSAQLCCGYSTPPAFWCDSRSCPNRWDLRDAHCGRIQLCIGLQRRPQKLVDHQWSNELSLFHSPSCEWPRSGNVLRYCSPCRAAAKGWTRIAHSMVLEWFHTDWLPEQSPKPNLSQPQASLSVHFCWIFKFCRDFLHRLNPSQPQKTKQKLLLALLMLHLQNSLAILPCLLIVNPVNYNLLFHYLYLILFCSHII